MAVLYGKVLRFDPARPDWPERDRFILSKGHACCGVCTRCSPSAASSGREWLDTYYQDGARLAGHVTHTGVPGVEVSTGSLGHGLPLGHRHGARR